MKNILPIVIAILFLTVTSITACSSGATNEIKAPLNQEFRLPVGSTAAITGEGLKIKFEAVTADSRCPQGVKCIWAGEAKCQTLITFNKTTVPLILTVTGSSLNQTIFESYTIYFNLEPYPKAQQAIDSNSYILVIKITQ